MTAGTWRQVARRRHAPYLGFGYPHPQNEVLVKQKRMDDARSLVRELKFCSMKRDLQLGRKIHAKAVETGNDSNMYLVTALVKMYANCGSMLDAHRMFDRIQKPDVVCWTIMILGYAENGDGLTALETFSRMKAGGCAPDSVTYVAALKACTSLAENGGKQDCLEWSRTIQLEIGCHMNHYVQNTLIDMYAKCDRLGDARRVFDSIKEPDVVSWNSLLLGYAENGERNAALDLFLKMKSRGCAPDSVTYVAAIKACTLLAVNGDDNTKTYCLERGREIHSEIGCQLDHYLQTTVIDMYTKCNSMVEARRVFDCIQKPDVVSWNSLLLGYAENGEGLASLELFSRMKALGFAPDCVTYVAALKACTSLAVNGDGSEKEHYLKRGRNIHSEIGFQLDHFLQSTLIDMYSKCSSMIDARRVFDCIQKPDVVSWTSLILGYAENGDGSAALDLFSKMKARGCLPNSITYMAALKACGLIGALVLGRKLHAEIRDFNSHVVTCLVDFYAKCGSLMEAREVFDLHSRTRIVSTWNALLAAYGSFGDSDSVFRLFQGMQDEGFQPDAVTFVCMLSCCSHAGFVEKAWDYFEAMTIQYGVSPTVMHYTCMVDVLGRANELNEEATVVLREILCNPDTDSTLGRLQLEDGC